MLGDVKIRVDDRPVDIAKTFSYKSMMFSDVPNLVSTFGYINASWTLRADLIAEYFCRLVNHMDEVGANQCTPPGPIAAWINHGTEDTALPISMSITGCLSRPCRRVSSIIRSTRSPYRKRR